MIKILCLDGGGAKGIIQAAILRDLEINLSKPINKIFDLIVGTSVGSILGGVLSGSNVSTGELLVEMKKALPEVFKRRLRIPIIQPKYKRDILISILEKYLKDKKMKECHTKYMCTSVSMTDGRTHFFKSWEQKDGELNLIDTINKSYAAPLYFGSIVDEETRSVWLDGGTGNMNCPLGEAYIETIRQGWSKGPVHIFSIGTGYSSYSIPYEKAKKSNNITQIEYYMNPADGGLSRLQNTQTQVEWVNCITKYNSNITFQRLDSIIPKYMNKMDKIEYMDYYEELGCRLSRSIDYSAFK